jgi:hypothetical protein
MKKLLFLFFLFAAQGYATTYYVSPTGSNTSPYDTWAKAANLPSSAITTGNGAAGPHTVYVAPGTYVDALTLTNANWASGTIIGTAAHGSTTAAIKGQVIVSSNSASFTLDVRRAGITVQNLSLTNTSTGYVIYIYTNGNNFTGSNLYVYDSASAILAYLNNGTNFSFTNCLFSGSGGSSGLQFLNATGTSSFNYCIFSSSVNNFLGTAIGIRNDSAPGTVTFNNCIMLGSKGTILQTSNAQAVTNVYNSVIGASSLASQPTITVSSGTANIYDSILIDSWGSAHALISGTLATDSNNIKHLTPKFITPIRSGYLIPRVDDIANLSYAQLVESKLSSYGMKGQYYVGASLIGANQSALQTLINNGTMSVGNHGYTEGSITITGTIFSVTKAGQTINVDRAANIITISSTGTVTGFKAKTLTAIRAELAALGCTNGAIQGSLSASSLGEAFADSAGAQASPYNIQVLIDATAATGLLKTETADSLALAQSLLTGYSAHFATPGGNTSNDIEAAIKAGGFSSNANVGVSAPFLSSYNVYKAQSLQGSAMVVSKTATAMADNGSGVIRVTTAANTFTTGDRVTIEGTVGTTEANGVWTITAIDTTHFDLQGSAFVHAWISGGYCSDDTQLAGNAYGLAEAIVQNGLFMQFLVHNTTEFSAHEWDIVLPIWASYPQLYVTNMDTVINALHASPWSTADNITYTRTWTDTSNLHLQPSSPAINAGVDVGLTTDIEGKPIRGLPDIGAYEFQKSGRRSLLGLE